MATSQAAGELRWALRLWTISTLFFLVGVWELVFLIAEMQWEHAGSLLVITAAYALVTMLLARRVVRQVISLNEVLRRVQAAEAGRREARARLAGVSLTAQEISHQLKNSLDDAGDSLDVLLQQHPLSLEVCELVEWALVGIAQANRHVARLQEIVGAETPATPAGLPLELAQSSRATT